MEANGRQFTEEELVRMQEATAEAFSDMDAHMAAREERRPETPLCVLLSKIAGEIGYLQKDGTNSAQRYNYLSERAVKQAVNEAFAKYGLIGEWTINLVKYERNEVNGKSGVDAVVGAQIIVTDGFDKVRCTGLGMGRDGQDKAVMQAQTAAVRECLKNLFIIVSGNDPEIAKVDEETGRTTKVAAKPQDIAKALIDKAKKATTADAVDALKDELKSANLQGDYRASVVDAMKAQKAKLAKKGK